VHAGGARGKRGNEAHVGNPCQSAAATRPPGKNDLLYFNVMSLSTDDHYFISLNKKQWLDEFAKYHVFGELAVKMANVNHIKYKIKELMFLVFGPKQMEKFDLELKTEKGSNLSECLAVLGELVLANGGVPDEIVEIIEIVKRLPFKTKDLTGLESLQYVITRDVMGTKVINRILDGFTILSMEVLLATSSMPGDQTPEFKLTQQFLKRFVS